MEFRKLFKLIKDDDYPKLEKNFSFSNHVDGEASFEPYYKEYILPHINLFELKRIKALRKLRERTILTIPFHLIIIVSAFVGIFFVIGLRLNDIGDAIEGIVSIATAASTALLYWAYKPVRDYHGNVKGKIFPLIFKFFGQNYIYNEKSRLQIKNLNRSGIIPACRSGYFEDHIKGSYKDVNLQLAEAVLTRFRNTKKKHLKYTYDEQVFQGMFILLDMNKNFSGKTIVKRDTGIVGNWFTKKFRRKLDSYSSRSKILKSVKLEDPVFEKKFEVYSSDQIEARYLLTTSFMERILELSNLFSKNKLKGKTLKSRNLESWVQCSFYENKLLIMVPTLEDRFEVTSIFQPATFVDDINLILNEMAIIFQIIDILKLEKRTGL